MTVTKPTTTRMDWATPAIPDDDDDTVADFKCSAGTLQLTLNGYGCTGGGVLQPKDNCQFTKNTSQTDTDKDGVGRLQSRQRL